MRLRAMMLTAAAIAVLFAGGTAHAATAPTSLHAVGFIADVWLSSPQEGTGASGFLGASARLTDATGVGIPGRTVTFTSAGVVLCSSPTDVNGWAGCSTSPAGTIIENGGYEADFSGDATFAPSHSHAGALDGAGLCSFWFADSQRGLVGADC